MKKILYLILILFSLVSLAACNEKEDNTTNNQDESPIDLSGVVLRELKLFTMVKNIVSMHTIYQMELVCHT